MNKKTLSLFFIFIVVGLLQSTLVQARNVASIEAPLRHEKLDFEPVEIVINLTDKAKPETFKAKLNRKDISHLFTDTNKGKTAQVRPVDGLRVYEEGERGRIYTKGFNFLMTRVKNKRGRWELDFRVFFVRMGKVETVRDEKGIWFITGSDTVSLYYIFEAMGYAVATDRLWQAETFRRAARGRLAEILGAGQNNGYLNSDIYMRILGYSEQELVDGFDGLDKESKKMIKGYIAGMNRRITEIRQNPELLPFEFKAIGMQLGMELVPEEYIPADILAWTALFQRNFDSEGMREQGQISNMSLVATLQALYPVDNTGNGIPDYWDMFNDLRWINDPAALTVIPGESAQVISRLKNKTDLPETINSNKKFKSSKSGRLNRIENRVAQVIDTLEKIHAYPKFGSYAWVVSGSKTASGNPMLYSGPQMGFDVPSIILEGSIQAGGLNVSGMSMSLVPGILVGRTPHHAWSAQVGQAHTVDYYIESQADVFLHRMETIRVAGQNDFIIPIFRSAHGPIINPIPYDPSTYVPSADNPIIAWKYAHWGYEFGGVKALLNLARAENMDDFGKGIEMMGVSMHFCYADIDGNIAYWMSGRDPVRPQGEWRFPQGFLPGLPVLEWDSNVLIPKSTDCNTSQGYYGGWNNKSRADYKNTPNTLSYYFGPFQRAHVVDEYLANHDNLSFIDVRNLALNITTTSSFGGGGNPWPFAAPSFIDAVLDNPAPDRNQAVTLLESWDGHFVDGGPTKWAFGLDRADAWVLMDAWIKEVIRLTFEDELGTDLFNQQRTDNLFNALLHGLDGEISSVINQYNWFQNLLNPNAPQTADEIIITALDNVLQTLGDQPWGIDQRGFIEYSHPMFTGTPLDPLHETPFSSRSTFAHCVEMGPNGPVRIESMFPLGESGNIRMAPDGSPIFDDHFFDMVPVYDSFAHRPFPLFD